MRAINAIIVCVTQAADAKVQIWRALPKASNMHKYRLEALTTDLAQPLDLWEVGGRQEPEPQLGRVEQRDAGGRRRRVAAILKVVSRTSRGIKQQRLVHGWCHVVVHGARLRQRLGVVLVSLQESSVE